MSYLDDDLFTDLADAPCCMAPEDRGEDFNCVCGDRERVLRAFLGGAMRPMTPAERQWCLEEADHAGEGAYPRAEAENYSDSALAERVLFAWADYVRSNCL